MSNAVSRGHGRGKPNNQDHNAATPMDQSQQFVTPYVNMPGQANYGVIPPNQMPQQPYRQFGGPPHYTQQNYHHQQQYNHNQPPPQMHAQPQQQHYGGGYNRQPYAPEQMYNPPYQYSGQVFTPNETVTYPQPAQPTMTTPAPPEPSRQRKPLLIVDPATQKAIDVPTRQTQTTVPAAPVVQPVPLAPEDEKKKEDISREMREKITRELMSKAAADEAAKSNAAAAAAAQVAPALPNFNVPPPTFVHSQQPPVQPTSPPHAAAPPEPKTPEAPAKTEEAPTQPEIVTPISSPQSSDTTTTTPASGTAESASSGRDARVTPTLQKEESKEEVEDDKFDEEERVDTPDVVESQTEKTPEELAEEKAQKEAKEKEEKQKLEAALEQKVKTLIENKDADVPNGVFGRAFMVTIREIEKLFSRTPCPLSPAQLADFGLDIKTMRVTDNKKPNFTPNWVPNNKGSRGQAPYRGRTTTDGTGRGAQQPRDRGTHNKRPPVVRQSIERVQRVALPSSKDAWKPDRQKASDNIPEEEASIKEVCKKVRALMNKVTPTSQVPLTQEFISYNVSSNEKQLSQVVEIVFDKAVEEPKFCALYAEMCKSQVNHELTKNNGKSSFRNTVLTRTQTFFQDKRDIDEEKLAVIEKEEDLVKREAMIVEEKQKFRRRKFGVMAFIGYLYRNSLLSTKIVQACCHELFGSILPKKVGEKEKPLTKEDIDEESVHCGLQLVETVGVMLDKSKDVTTAFLDQWFQKLEAAKPHCSNKIRFMIMNLIELRKDKWVPRKSTETGPKKIDEIHKDVQREKIENEKARDQYDRDRDRGRHGGGVRPNSNSLRKQAPVSRNSLDRNRQAQHPEQKRAAATAATKLATSTVQPKNISISAMDAGSLGGKKKEWHSGASGGGNASEAAAAAPLPVKPAWGRRDSNDQRKRSAVDEKQAVLDVAKGLGSMNMAARRSTSQTSIPDKVEEELSDAQRKQREKIMNTVKSDIAEVVSGDCPLKEMVDAINKEYVGSEKYAKPTLPAVYSMIVRTASEKALKDEERKKLATVLRMSLVSKVHKQAFIDGVVMMCKFAVETELQQDFPKLWSVTAEVIMNVMHVHHDLIEETPVESISLNEMSPAFMAAKGDIEGKKYELFVHLMQRWTEDELTETQTVDALAWEFSEMAVKEEMIKGGLKEEMEAVTASNGKTLSALLMK